MVTLAHVGPLSGPSGATITNTGAAASTLTVTVTSETSEYEGTITEGGETLALIKAGNGTLILSGTIARIL